MKCDYRSCQKEATHHPKVCVPATGLPIEGHQPLECIIGVPVCKKHARAFPVQQWFTDPNINITEQFEALAAGRRAPDFTRAFVVPVGIHTEEAQKFRTSAMMQNAARQSVSHRH